MSLDFSCGSIDEAIISSAKALAMAKRCGTSSPSAMPEGSLVHGRRWIVSCRDAEDFLSDFDDKSIHCVLTGPPYWGRMAYGCGPREIGIERTQAAHVSRLASVFLQAKRALRDDGNLIVVLDDARRQGYLEGTSTRFVSAMMDQGWGLASEIAWVKRNAPPQGNTAEDRPTDAWTPVFLFGKRGSKRFWDGYAVRERAVTGWRNMRNILDVAAVPPKWAKGIHFATFPLELAKRLLRPALSGCGCCPDCGTPLERAVMKASSEARYGDTAMGRLKAAIEGRTRTGSGGNSRTETGAMPSYATPDRLHAGWVATCGHAVTNPAKQVVVDPFCGSGTTGVAAVGMGHAFAGSDLNGRNVRLSAKALASAEDGLEEWAPSPGMLAAWGMEQATKKMGDR